MKQIHTMYKVNYISSLIMRPTRSSHMLSFQACHLLHLKHNNWFAYRVRAMRLLWYAIKFSDYLQVATAVF